MYASRKTQSGYVAEPPQAARLNRLADVGFCSAKAVSSQEPPGAEAQTDAASLAPYGTRLWYLFFWRLLDVFTKRLHGYERRLAEIGAGLRRIRAPVCRVMEEAEALLKYFNVVAGFPPEVVAVAVLWTAAKAAGAPR